MSLEPELLYREVWGVGPDESQPWTHDDLTRDSDEPQEDSVREVWAVFQDGHLASLQLYPSESFAQAAAVGWARSYPHATIKHARIEIHEPMVRG